MKTDYVVPYVSADLSSASPVVVHNNIHVRYGVSQYDMHYGLELGIVLAGRMRRFYRDWKMDLQRGEVWMCGMWEPHGFEVIKSRCRVLVLVIWPAMLSTMRFEENPELNLLRPFLSAPEFRPKASGSNRKEILQIANRILKVQSYEQSRRRLWLRLLLMELLMILQEGWEYSSETKPMYSESFSRINPAVQLAVKARKMVTVQEASHACRMSRNYFSRMFESMMGLSFASFAIRYRLSRSAEELLQTDKPIKAIARGWGFTDTSHFCHRFSEHYGCLPGQYRK